MTLSGAMARGRHNNFDLIRLVAAMAVVVSHAWPLALGPGAAEPLQALTGHSLGGVAVLVFFFLSGLMISESAARWQDRKMIFVSARVLRIFPGLAVALIVTAALAVLSGSTAGLAELLRYVAKGLSLVSIEHQLSQAWATNPYPGAVNGPLWTLFYEVLCYAIFAGFVWARVIHTSVSVALLLGLAVALMLRSVMPEALAYRLGVFWPLALAFGLGHLAWMTRGWLPLWRPWVGLWVGVYAVAQIAVALYADGTIAARFYMLLPVFCWLLLVLAYQTPVIHLPGDISYGVYIYGWPVAQACIALLPGLSPLGLAVTSGLAVLPFAVASWILVERPCLSVTRHLRLRLQLA